MDIEKSIAIKLRNALELAHKNHELDMYYPFKNFPYNCCEHTCDILGNLLLAEGIRTIQVNGRLKGDPSRHHVWLKTLNGLIIDITEDQFSNELLRENEVEIVRVGTEGPVQKMFCFSREEQPNTFFMDRNLFNGFGGTPDVRQKRLIEVYDAIKKYL